MSKSSYVIADALVHVAAQTPDDQLGALCDHAIELLQRQNPHASLREFLQLVQRAAIRQNMQKAVVLLTPDGHTAESLKERLEAALASATQKPVTIIETADPALKGGGTLLIGDERLELSISHLLSTLEECFAATSSTSL